MPAFDPYHQWLGIPPGEQPPDHYRLLGVPLFESDLDVIEAAAQRQTVFLRTLQLGPQSELAERLLNEVARARVTLLIADQKAAYDDKLRKSLPTSHNRPPPFDADVLSAEVDRLREQKQDLEQDLQREKESFQQLAAHRTEEQQAIARDLERRRQELEERQVELDAQNLALQERQEKEASRWQHLAGQLEKERGDLQSRRNEQETLRQDLVEQEQQLEKETQRLEQERQEAEREQQQLEAARQAALEAQSKAQASAAAAELQRAELEKRQQRQEREGAYPDQEQDQQRAPRTDRSETTASDETPVRRVVTDRRSPSMEPATVIPVMVGVFKSILISAAKWFRLLVIGFIKSILISVATWFRPRSHKVGLVVVGVLFLIVLFLTKRPPLPFSEGLIAYYPFNGNAKDESGNGNDGEDGSEVFEADRFANRRSAYKTNGNEPMQLVVSDLPTGSAHRTVSLWTNVKPTGEAQGLAAWGSASRGRAFSLLVHPGYDNKFIVSAWGAKYDISSNVRADGKWHHLVGVYDGALKIYVNGSLSARAVRSIDTLKTSVWVGAQVTRSQRAQGSIDDVRIYNRALSAEEVKALYDHESTPLPKTTKCKTGLRRESTTPPLAIIPFTAEEAKQHQQSWADYLESEVAVSNDIGMKFVLIPPGEFTMGSPPSEAGRYKKETQHIVRITKAFYLSVHEVTQSQYERVMGKNPSYFSALGDGKVYVSGMDSSEFPVETVTWNDAVEFCRILSKQEGVEYRLPTEAEWEYACRAGTTTSYSSGSSSSELDAVGWYGDNSGKTVIDSRSISETDKDNYFTRLLANGCRPHIVGGKSPNAWELYDMHGNVWEWCQDWYASYASDGVDPTGPVSGERRVLRGGAFNIPPRFVRSAFRHFDQPDYWFVYLGFRLARTYNISPAVTGSTVDKPVTPPATPPESSPTKLALAAPIKKLMTPEQVDLGGPIVNSIDIVLVPIPAGQFTMGSPESEPDRYSNEIQHRVRITKPFYLSAHEVTQQQYESVMQVRPWEGKDYVKEGPDYPATYVTWDAAVAFCDELSQSEGVEYRLPTEAQWEYACRAGTATAYSFGGDVRQLPQHAWYSGSTTGSTTGSTHPVGELKPNAWGLFDMHGNVWEWCEDWYGTYETKQMLINPSGPASGSRRVLRGGAFDLQPRYVRAAFRLTYRPVLRLPNGGFRLTRTYPLSP